MERTNQSEALAHQLNISDLLRDIYQLLSFFLASRQIAELEQSSLYGSNDPIFQFKDIERDLITNNLISIAIKIRILDDREPHKFDMFTDYCGSITKDILNPLERNGLALRDACNKIIHARKVNFDVDSTTTGQLFLHPYIYLEGTETKWKKNHKHEVVWSTDIDIVMFCRESAAAIQTLIN